MLADILTDYPERFAQMRDAYLSRGPGEPEAIVLEHSWLHKGRVVLKLAGTDTISAAETLRGAELVVPAADRMKVDADTIYIADLVGCALVDAGQTGAPTIGVVRDVVQQEQTADLLLIESGDGMDHAVPFAKAYLVRMDLPGRRLEMRLPPGLLEVNAPLSEEEKTARDDAN